MRKLPNRVAGPRTPSSASEAPASPTPDSSGPDTGERRRPTRAGGGLPRGRALVGGLLVAVAMVVVFAATIGAGDQPSALAVTARVSLPAGHVLTTSDLVTRPVDLPPGTAQAAFASVDELIGATTVAPLAADELIQRSAVALDGRLLSPAHEFSFPVERERAVDGDLRPGETVDLLATFGSGAGASTSVLARRATVIAVQGGGGTAIGSGGDLVLTIALASADAVLDVAHAAQVADLTVVRATRAGDDAPTRDRVETSGRAAGDAPTPIGAGQ